MILYSYLGISQKNKKTRLKSFVSLGGPGNLAHSSPVLGKIALKYISFLRE
ncbi:MAG: hypothetical protein IPO06_06965 [Leptospiraceae bacterium]|nr:hypothetical protein [Leptospiraceae bacterium]